MLQLCVCRDIEHLGSWESTQEARVARGAAECNSYASFVLSQLPACSISRHTHADGRSIDFARFFINPAPWCLASLWFWDSLTRNTEAQKVIIGGNIGENRSYNRRWQRGGHDPVSRTNFNKIHASRTVLTRFHESWNGTVLNQLLSEKPQENEIFTTKNKSFTNHAYLTR